MPLLGDLGSASPRPTVPATMAGLKTCYASTARNRGVPLATSKAASTLPKMLQHHEIAAVPDGLLSSFRDWAAEKTDHPREVIEAALPHVVQNEVETAYARLDLFEPRRLLMDDWAE